MTTWLSPLSGKIASMVGICSRACFSWTYIPNVFRPTASLRVWSWAPTTRRKRQKTGSPFVLWHGYLQFCSILVYGGFAPCISLSVIRIRTATGHFHVWRLHCLARVICQNLLLGLQVKSPLDNNPQVSVCFLCVRDSTWNHKQGHGQDHHGLSTKLQHSLESLGGISQLWRSSVTAGHRLPQPEKCSWPWALQVGGWNFLQMEAVHEWWCLVKASVASTSRAHPCCGKGCAGPNPTLFLWHSKSEVRRLLEQIWDADGFNQHAGREREGRHEVAEKTHIHWHGLRDAAEANDLRNWDGKPWNCVQNYGGHSPRSAFWHSVCQLPRTPSLRCHAVTMPSCS